MRHLIKKMTKKNIIWFSKYNFYICGKLENPFF